MLKSNLFEVRKADIETGFTLVDWKNFSDERDAAGRKVVESLDLAAVLGDTVEFVTKSKEKVVKAKGDFRTMFLNKDAWPARSRDSARVIGGSIDVADFDGNRQIMISRRRENDDAVYVKVTTGVDIYDRRFKDIRDEDERVRTAIQAEIRDMIMRNEKPVSHGAFLLTGEDSLGSTGGTAVGDMVTGISSAFSGFLRGPARRHTLWRLGVNVPLIVREVNGIIFTITYDGKEVFIDDGTAYTKYFEDRMAIVEEQARKRRAEWLEKQKQKRLKTQQKGPKSGSADEAKVDSVSVDSNTEASEQKEGTEDPATAQA